MIERVVCLICLVLGYLCGNIQSAFIIGKIMGKDMRKEGSGNLGATNMMRVMGFWPGLLTFVFDLLKVFLAIFLANIIVLNGFKMNIDSIALCLYTGLGVVLGHNFPFYLNFKGGKGVAATCAVIISLLDWRLIVIGALFFFVSVLITKFVSLGSLLLVSSCFVAFIIFAFTDTAYLSAVWRPDCIIIFAVLTVLVFVQHRENIKRLKTGTEKRFSIKK